MTEHSDELTGPDLTKGVDISGIGPGQIVTGHAFNEPVLLVRAEQNWYAVGAKCTHYGAPLDQGLLANDMIRCPWHHACFDMRNGAAACAPALTDLASYDVVVEATVARVTRKRDAVQLAARPHPSRGARAPDRVLFEEHPITGPKSVLIIGAGAAGNACAEMLRRDSYRGPITMIDPDTDAPYDRPNLSKDYLAGNAPEEWLPLHPREFYETQKIELLTGIEVVALDTKAKTVQLSNGQSRQYGSLLIATGASPIRLPIPGGDQIFYLRSLRDCRTIIAKTEGAKNAVVIGASFIGLEVAASLIARGLHVDVVAPEQLPLQRVLGTELGDLIKHVHEEKGVTFHLGRSVKSVEDNAVVLDDGSRLEAQLVVAGVGVRPNLALAEKAGIRIDNGIAVDEFLETSVAGVFAAGDVARWPDAYSDVRLRVEHWVVAERQGQTAARNMLGKRERFDDIPFFWSAHYDSLSIRYTGHVDHWDSTVIEGDVMKQDCAVLYMVGGKRRAIATINRDRRNLETEADLENELLMKPPPPITLEPEQV
jgi:NADPH-dependent 2,4-dienoyl-CoA reductase/sulfur reductase-like enzyme/nitrite reductase/ring-hydroxylating ferredoxin subunit